MLPSVGSIRSAMSRMRVVLPQPEGPMRLTNWPSRMVRLASCSATASALPTTKRLPTPLTSMIGEGAVIQLTAHGRGLRCAPEQPAARGVADELTALHRHLTADGHVGGAPVDLHALEAGVIRVHAVRLGA